MIEVNVESALLEIVELDNGDIVLQPAAGGSPLLTIRFAKNVMPQLQAVHMEIATAMIQAGVQAFGEIADAQGWAVYEDLSEKPTLH